MLEPVQLLEPHARKCLRVQNASGAVGCLQPAVANKGIAIASKRKTLDKLNCAQYSFHSVNDHQVVEEDDAEEDHHTQPVLVSTVDATVFPDCLNFLVFAELGGKANCAVDLVTSFFHESFILPRDSLVLTSLVRLVFDCLNMILTPFRTFVFLAN